MALSFILSLINVLLHQASVYFSESKELIKLLQNMVQ
jgi:hypothetical protein